MAHLRALLAGLALLLPACGGARAEAGTVEIPAPAPEPAASESAAPDPRPPASPARAHREAVRPSQGPRGPGGAAISEAETLFREAKIEMAHGAYLSACAKLEASWQLDPALGTLLNLAECQRQAGNAPAACQLFRSAAQQAQAAGQVDREQLARTRLTAMGCPP